MVRAYLSQQLLLKPLTVSLLYLGYISIHLIIETFEEFHWKCLKAPFSVYLIKLCYRGGVLLSQRYITFMWSSIVSVTAAEEGKLGNGNNIVLAWAPEAVLTFSVPSRLWCAVARFHRSAPRGEGAERGRRGLKVERFLHWAVSALQPRQAQPQPSGSFPRPYRLLFSS